MRDHPHRLSHPFCVCSQGGDSPMDHECRQRRDDGDVALVCRYYITEFIELLSRNG